MWNPFKKRDKGGNASEPQVRSDEQPNTVGEQPNTVDALANNLQQEGRLGELEQELEKLDQSSMTEAEKASWWHLYGIAAFRAGRDGEATSRFEEGHKRFPGHADIRFSLGQQYVRARRIQEGFELFVSCKFPEAPSKFVLAQVRYAYLWNRYPEGRAMLRPFLEAYKELKILDDHFLYIRGLPFFGTWWSNLAALSILDRDTEELEEVTEYVATTCHDYDFEYLRAELSAHRDNRPELLLGFLEKRLQNASAGFDGAACMKIAIIKGRMTGSAHAAEELLNAVNLSDQDFPWLQDIRTLAKAEIAHRFNQVEVEQEHVEAFLGRQRMLFEPNIALDFHLLRYQERLKPTYQSRDGP